MAFVVGNRARVKLTSTALSGSGLVVLNPQPPLLGVVQAIAGGGGAGDDITVLFGDGKTLVVHGAFLDPIADLAALVRNAYLDKVVTGWITIPSGSVAGVPFSSAYTDAWWMCTR